MGALEILLDLYGNDLEEFLMELNGYYPGGLDALVIEMGLVTEHEDD